MGKDTTNDMTVGNPVKLIIRFMIPMCLGITLQIPLLQDSFWVWMHWLRSEVPVR